ncbi:MAG TPA: hypothetical protein VFW46_20195 [Stellaceae bacterium]|nr:hypothetical protein [Stellaceae bacterium]
MKKKPMVAEMPGMLNLKAAPKAKAKAAPKKKAKTKKVGKAAY